MFVYMLHFILPVYLFFIWCLYTCYFIYTSILVFHLMFVYLFFIWCLYTCYILYYQYTCFSCDVCIRVILYITSNLFFIWCLYTCYILYYQYTCFSFDVCISVILYITSILVFHLMFVYCYILYYIIYFIRFIFFTCLYLDKKWQCNNFIEKRERRKHMGKFDRCWKKTEGSEVRMKFSCFFCYCLYTCMKIMLCHNTAMVVLRFYFIK